MAEEQTGAAPAAEQAPTTPPIEGAAPAPPPTTPDPAPPPDATAVASPEPPPGVTPAEPSAPAEPEPRIESGAKPTDGAEAAPVEGAAPPERPKTLLAEAVAEGEAKPAEPAAPAPAEAGAEEGTDQAHAYEAFTLPEGAQIDRARLDSYAETLGKYGVTQEGGQALLDMHLAEVQRLASHYEAEQYRVFSKTVNDWATQTMADEVLGGAGHETAKRVIMSAINRLTHGNEAQRAGLLQALEYSGLGSHPEVLRTFYNAGRILAEPSSLKTTTSEIRPVPDRGGAVRPRSRTSALYPNTNFENGLGR